MLEVREVDYGSERYRELVAFRRRILRTPLGLEFTAEQLAAERADTHIAACLEGKLVGCVASRFTMRRCGTVTSIKKSPVTA